MKAIEINLEIASGPHELAEKAAKVFFDECVECVRKKEIFYAAISGVSTPRGMHKLLAKRPLAEKIPWYATHLFWVDERLVPVESAESNYGTAERDFLQAIPISRSNVHPVIAKGSPEETAKRYEHEILCTFDLPHDQVPRFDLIFLGIGEDGHTASLFPGQTSSKWHESLVLAARGGNPYVCRVTFSLRLINSARKVVFLVSGARKAKVLKDIIENSDSTAPAAQVHPKDGSLVFIVDVNASSKLSLTCKYKPGG